MSQKTINQNSEREAHIRQFLIQIKNKSDNLMNYFLVGYFIAGLALAPFFDTWTVAIGIGGLSLLAYYSARLVLPDSNLYQYVLGAVFGVFMAQYIYQMHGLFEMHFIAFIGSAMLITYQNWKLQIPILLVVVAHHATFGYLQYTGFSKIYFTQLEYMDLQTFIIHVILAGIIFCICGLWAYQFKQNSEAQMEQSFEIGRMGEEKAQKKALEELNATLDRKVKERTLQLEQTNKELEAFSYSVSHDLRAPLRIINGFSKLLQRGYSKKLDEEGKEHLDAIMSNSKQMGDLIDDLLNFSRLGRASLATKAVNMDELVKAVVEELKVTSKITEIRQHNLKIADCDPTLVKQVWVNLISNAAKYSRKREKPSIEIGTKDNNGNTVYYVKDNGAGFDMQHADKLFGVFQRLHKVTEYEGTGVGLALVHRIITKHGGKIWAEGEVNRGATFYFTLQQEISKTN